MDATLGQIIRDLTLLSEECARLQKENAALKARIAELEALKARIAELEQPDAATDK